MAVCGPLPGRSLYFRALIALALLSLFAGCESMPPRVRPPLGDKGAVLLYVEPFTQEAARLRFGIETIFAKAVDGGEFPVSIKLMELSGKEMTRQRFLGEADLPPGLYAGFTLKVKNAFLRGQEGEAALLAPEAPVTIVFPFRVERKRASVLTFAFRERDAVTSGMSLRPDFVVAIPPRPVSGLTGYVTNETSNNITIFDKKAGEVAGVIATEGGPAGLALDQTGLKAYAAVPTADAIEVVDVVAGEITDRIRLNLGDRPGQLALTPDGKTLLSANTGSNSVSFIDTASLAERGRVTVGNGPGWVVVDSMGRRAYVMNHLSSSVSVLDIANRGLVTTIGTDPGPLQCRLNNAGDTLYVIHEWSPYVSVIDTGRLTVKKMPVTMGLCSIKVDTFTGLIYMARVGDRSIGVYDPNALVPVDYVNASGDVTDMTIDGDMNNLIMVGRDSMRLDIVNIISRKTLSVIDVGEIPYRIAVMGGR
jgi:YVTN family beta-propeller protein